MVTPSIGIAMYPEHGSDAQSLLKNADGAMCEAKASGRNQLRVYDSTMNVRALKRLSLETELRWFHPERGQIPTADFIELPEAISARHTQDRPLFRRRYQR